MRSPVFRMERILKHLERHQADGHARAAIKEWLLVSRAVIDSCIDCLEEKPNNLQSRKIDISEE